MEQIHKVQMQDVQEKYTNALISQICLLFVQAYPFMVWNQTSLMISVFATMTVDDMYGIVQYKYTHGQVCS